MTPGSSINAITLIGLPHFGQISGSTSHTFLINYRILGVQLIGKGVSELINTAVAHMEYGGSAEDLARTLYAHPTLSEAIKEAALAVEGKAPHSR